MFELCRDVKIYKIQNHYHYYPAKNENKFENQSWKQLKVSPIEIQTKKKYHSKGISLSVNNKNLSTTYDRRNPSNVRKNQSSNNLRKHENIQRKINRKNLPKVPNPIEKLEKWSQIKYHPSSSIQNLHRKSKPVIKKVELKKQEVDELAETKRSSTLVETNQTSTLRNFSGLGSIKKLSYQEFPIQTEVSFEDDQQNQDQKQLFEERNLRTIQSITEPSIMFSDLLYREEREKTQELKLWAPELDRMTSKSIYDSSQKSVRIQESIICDRDVYCNFLTLPQQLIRENYTLKLAVERNIECIISLTQIPFKYMGMVSVQIQLYEMVKAQLGGRTSYQHILELYQTQISKSSYILIKQPYTNIVSQVPAQRKEQMLEMVTEIIEDFERIRIYPTRLLKLDDIVECMGVYKIHGLSAFKNQKSSYGKEAVLESLEALVKK